MSTTSSATKAQPYGAAPGTEEIVIHDESDQQTTSKPPAPKRQKRVRTHRAPVTKPIPTNGWPAIRYQFYKLIGRPDWVPNLNQHDRIELEISEYEDLLRELAATYQITVSFMNLKGTAGKSTLAVNVCSIISHVTHRIVWIIPTTEVASNSTMSLNTGITPGEDTYTVSEFHDQLDNIGTYRKKSKGMRLSKFGVRALLEDSTQAEDFTNEKFTKLFNAVLPDSDFIALDHANGSVRTGKLSHEAAKVSNVLVFSANDHIPVTQSSLVKTIENLTDETKAGQSVTDKIRNPFIVVNAVTKRKRYMKGPMAAFAAQVQEVRWDDYLSQEDVPPADLEKIDRRTYLDYLRVAVNIYHRAAAETLLKPSSESTAPEEPPATVAETSPTPQLAIPT